MHCGSGVEGSGCRTAAPRATPAVRRAPRMIAPMGDSAIDRRSPSSGCSGLPLALRDRALPPESGSSRSRAAAGRRGLLGGVAGAVRREAAADELEAPPERVRRDKAAWIAIAPRATMTLRKTQSPTWANVSENSNRVFGALGGAPERPCCVVERSRSGPRRSGNERARSFLSTARSAPAVDAPQWLRACLSSRCMLLAFPGAVWATAHPARPRPRSDTHGDPYTRVAGRSEPPNRGSAKGLAQVWRNQPRGRLVQSRLSQWSARS